MPGLVDNRQRKTKGPGLTLILMDTPALAPTPGGLSREEPT
jgi:hypothetical protein